MENSIILSIIIPYYNSDEWIGKMLDSLLDQDISKASYEIIVIDDGSTQDISNLLKYKEQYPELIKYHRKENGGMSDARNVGIDMAVGKWIYFCDSDDFVHPQVLGSLINTAEVLDLDMLTFGWRVVQPNATIYDQSLSYSVSEVKTGKDYIATFTNDTMSIGFGVGRYFIKKSILEENKIRFENILFTEDRIFQLELLLVIERIAHAGINVYYYVQHQSSITHQPKRNNYSKFAQWLWHYIEKLTDTINDDSLNLNIDAITVINGWRDMAVFSILINSFKYCPVSTTKHYLQLLQNIKGAYPPMIRSPKRYVRWTRYCMGHKRLWLFLCRVFHLLPLSVRQSL